MKKVKALVNFSITKEMTVEIPDNMTLEEYLDTDSNAFVNLSERAASEFSDGISDYLVPENFAASEDTEIPE